MRQQLNLPYVNAASTLRLYLSIFVIFAGIQSVASAEGVSPYRLPHFREAASNQAPPVVEGAQSVKLLADAAFPPFSFATQNGPSGIAVDLALAACAETKIVCEVTLLPYADLLPAMAKGDGDAVIAGPRIDDISLDQAEITRPYFRTLGRFAVQSGNPLENALASSLDGKRIGVLKDSAYEAWLKAYYARSAIQTFASEAETLEALRTGAVDAVFGDNLHLIYWIAGDAAKGCCKLLDHAFSDLDYFSRNISFFVRSGHSDLRAILDYGLDQLQTNGTTDRIFNRYVPLNPW